MASATILIVEDNPLNLELATDVLESAGYAIRQARTAEEGLVLAKEIRPDLILMDISLPGMDGRDAVRQIKADGAIRHIPTIALTAFAMAGDEEQAMAAGFDGYITKPIHTRTFPAAVARFLELRGAGG
jgi:CheY-like chemotaxis protein